jgi:hypothetical protein
MNPLHGTTATPEGLIPEAHGYGYVAPSEAPVVRPAASTPPAHDKPSQDPSGASETHPEPLIEFITDEPAAESKPAALETEPATAQLFLSPLLPNIGTSTMARMMHLPEVPVSQDIPDDAVRLLVVEASEKGMAAVFSHIDRVRAQLPETPGSVTSLKGVGGILVIPADSKRTPRTVKLKLKVLSGAHPVLMCPWIPALASRLCDDEALAKAAEARPVAAALKKLTAQIEGLAG